MMILYNILRNFLVYFAPIVIIIFSISLGLSNANLHKQTLKNTDFYNKLSSEIKKLNTNQTTNQTNTEDPKTDPKTLAQNSAFSLFGGSISDLATPEWLEKVATKNIDLTSDWLLEKQNEWTFYFPTTEVQTSLNQNLDKETKELVNINKTDITECSSENLEKLKSGDFDLVKNFCLPKEVKDGTSNLSDFLPKIDINSLTSGLDLSSNIDNFKAQNLGIASSGTYEFFVATRQYLTKIRNGSPYVLAGFAVVLLIITILAGTIGRSVRKDLISNLWKISLSTLSLAAVFILILGGLFVLNSWATNWLLPGSNLPGLSELLTYQWLWFLFDLVSLAVWIGLAMVIFNLVLLILPKGNTEKLNKHLQERPEKTNFENNSQNSDYSSNYKASNSPENPNNYVPNSLENGNQKSNINRNYPDFENDSDNLENNFDNQENVSKNQSFSNFDTEFQKQIQPKSVSKPISPKISDIIRHEKSDNLFQTPTQIPRTRSIPPQNFRRNGQNIEQNSDNNYSSNYTSDNLGKSVVSGSQGNNFVSENHFPTSPIQQVYNPLTNSDNYSDNFENENLDVKTNLENPYSNSQSINSPTFDTNPKNPYSEQKVKQNEDSENGRNNFVLVENVEENVENIDSEIDGDYDEFDRNSVENKNNPLVDKNTNR